MRHRNHSIPTLICLFIIAVVPLLGQVRILVRNGRPVVDGVYVNGHGPYRFLVDTGTNVDLIETNLAQSIGLASTFRSELTSSTGMIAVPGADGVEVVLGPVQAPGQKFLFSGMETIHHLSPDIQGVLGQWFLSQFDYTLDLRNNRLDFGQSNHRGMRVPFRMINGRLAFSTSLGNLILDSGADRLILFGVKPDLGSEDARELRTVSGYRKVGMISGKTLTVEGRKIWRGDVVAIPNRYDPAVDGLMPLNLFKAIFVSNSAGYAVFEQ